jgi:hypothetical protein
LLREGTVTRPANVPRAIAYAEGDEIKDAEGNVVGTVVVVTPGQLDVEREDVEAYVPAGNEGGISPGLESFTFYLPLNTVVQNLDGVANWIDADTYWDSVFREGDSPQYDQEVGKSPAQPIPQPLDITPQWIEDVFSNSNLDLGRTFDTGLDHVDAFFAGFASTVSGGISDKIRSGIYGGYIDVDQSDSNVYTAGQILGIAPAIATGILSGGTTATLGTAGHVARASKVITTVDTVHSFYNTGSKLAAGEQLELGDYLAFSAPAGFAGKKTVDWIVSKFGKGFVASKGALFSSNELASVERASAELIEKVGGRRVISWADEGTDALRYLNYRRAEAASLGAEDIILRRNPGKAAVLEEFLHGTQQRLGIIDKLGRDGAERHVKDFMIRHRNLLGLGDEDVEILRKLMELGL